MNHRVFILLALLFVTALFSCEKAQEMADDAKQLAVDAADKAGVSKKDIWDMTAAPALQLKLASVGITPDRGGQEITDGIFAYAVEGNEPKGMKLIEKGVKKASPQQVKDLAAKLPELAETPGLGGFAESFKDLSKKILQLVP